eukprot:scaffold1778_cov63-Cyclotella_meneghiniana.AAC.5
MSKYDIRLLPDNLIVPISYNSSQALEGGIGIVGSFDVYGIGGEYLREYVWVLIGPGSSVEVYNLDDAIAAY